MGVLVEKDPIARIERKFEWMSFVDSMGNEVLKTKNRHRVGIGLLITGLGLASIPMWVAGASVDASHVLVHPLASHLGPVKKVRAQTLTPVKRLPEPALGTTVAQLRIPALDLSVPVVQGTSSSILLSSPGHYVGSVLPGERGASVIAAHNATFFRHIDQLKNGSHIVVTTVQGAFTYVVYKRSIVADTAGLPNTTAPTLDLEACYPLNALYFTSKRYIVRAKLIQSNPLESNFTKQSSAVSPSTAPFIAEIPAAISSRYSLQLKDNSLPMGTFTYQAPKTTRVLAFQQSSSPLQSETVAIALWIAYKDASQSGNASTTRALWDKSSLSPVANPYWRARTIQFEAPLNVRMTLTPNGQPEKATLSDSLIRVDGRVVKATMVVGFHGVHMHILSVQTSFKD